MVYPRGHGESRRGLRFHYQDAGLSPWARGILVRQRPKHLLPRSIPVGTGNPARKAYAGASYRVYPRGHGESGGVSPRVRGERGLSPWARGIRDGSVDTRCCRRSIPVGTGNPQVGVAAALCGGVYPRGHGESARLAALLGKRDGLSPWARGILVPPMPTIQEDGSIPVGTGNPDRLLVLADWHEVYPRGHGESERYAGPLRNLLGLSPWARGIRRRAR